MILDLILLQTLFIAEKALSTKAVEAAMVFFSATSLVMFCYRLSEIGIPSRKSFLALSSSSLRIDW